MRLKFSKNERLASKKIIERLFRHGNQISFNSFTLFWTPNHNLAQRIEILISVPKKKVAKAVNRNYIKRIMRECYRKNKDDIYGLLSKNIHLALVYNRAEIINYAHLEKELLEIFNLLGKKVNENI